MSMSCKLSVNTWLTAIFIATILCANKFPFRINLTGSMPRGIYLLDSPRIVHRGDLVMLCLPSSLSSFALQRGYLRAGDCKNGAQPVIKKVAAQSGDNVLLLLDQVKINGATLPHSVTLPADQQHHFLPAAARGVYLIGQNQVWLYGTSSALSWDSRYFGVINTRQITHIVKPLFTWENRSS